MKPPTTKWLTFAPLLLPAVYLFFSPFPQGWIDVGLFLLLAFCYWHSMQRAKRRILAIGIQLIVVSVFVTIHTPWHLCFAFYPALAMSLLPSYRRISGLAAVMVICLTAAISLSAELSSEPLRFEWLPIALALIAVPYVTRMYQFSCEMQMKLSEAHDAMIKNDERARIARDLHDTLGQTLSMISVKSELVERLIDPSPDQAHTEIADVQRIARTALLQVRELVNDMQAIDIKEELQRAGQMLASAGIEAEIHARIEMKAMLPIVRNILGMCLRECITNVVRHSGAASCSIKLMEEEKQYLLIVRDNGIGISAGQDRVRKLGAGLLGMNERLSLIEGTLELETDAENRTKVAIAIPRC